MSTSKQPSKQQSHLSSAAVIVIVAVLYFITARIGFSLAINPGNVTAVWAPSGFALAATLMRGTPALGGILLGSLVVNALFYSHLSPGGASAAGISSSIMIAIGSTAQSWLAAHLLRQKIHIKDIVTHPYDALVFLLVAAASCVVASSMGVLSLLLFGFIPPSQIPYTWLTWWVGDLGGMLLYAPLILSWRNLPEFAKSPRMVAEFILFLALLMLCCYGIFDDTYWGRQHFALQFLTFPFLMWAAGRFGVHGVVMTIPIVEVFAIIGMRQGFGPLVLGSQNESLLVLALYMAVLTIVGLTFACVLTQWQRFREKLESAAQELETKVEERTAELELANRNLCIARDRAIEASNIKSAFVANISHELRTPLSGILGTNELLLAQEQPEENRYLLQMMHDSANSLLSVVNDILDLAKIEAGKVTIENEPFSPVFLVQDCAKLLAPAAAAKELGFDISLDQHMPDFVFGDGTRVRQILLNLIGNAIKFTERGSITVRVHVERQDENHAELRFSVSDTGMGINELDQALLFTPFSQVDAGVTRKYGGTGLGLAISKHFVKLMSGDIGCDSEEKKGSTFWFKITFDKKRVQNIEEPGGKPRHQAVTPVSEELARSSKVLVVEDNEALRLLALRQLAFLGVDATGIACGEEAVHLARTGEFNLVLMDVNLPDISGNAATSAIRALERDNHRGGIPIIAMTAGAMSGDREQALKAGMNDYMAKPVTLEQLKICLEKWLGRTTGAPVSKPRDSLQ